MGSLENLKRRSFFKGMTDIFDVENLAGISALGLRWPSGDRSPAKSMREAFEKFRSEFFSNGQEKKEIRSTR